MQFAGGNQRSQRKLLRYDLETHQLTVKGVGHSAKVDLIKCEDIKEVLLLLLTMTDSIHRCYRVECENLKR